jgi:hypothetical protein
MKLRSHGRNDFEPRPTGCLSGGRARNSPLVMGVALQAHVSGQPFRLRPLRAALRHVQAAGSAVRITDTDRIAAAWRR